MITKTVLSPDTHDIAEIRTVLQEHCALISERAARIVQDGATFTDDDIAEVELQIAEGILVDGPAQQLATQIGRYGRKAKVALTIVTAAPLSKLSLPSIGGSILRDMAAAPGSLVTLKDRSGVTITDLLPSRR